MYQAMMGAMNLALLANNIGLLWVAVEIATLTTVVMVGIYRTPQALEAAWKYFILGSVGIALALFGTILVYLAAQPVLGEGLDAMALDRLIAAAGRFDPALLNLAFVFLLVGYGTKVGSGAAACLAARRPCRGPDADLGRAVRPAAQRGALCASCASRWSWRPTRALAPGPLMVAMGLLLARCSPPSCSTGGATSNGCSPTPRSSTWASSPSPSAWAARSPTSPACCT